MTMAHENMERYIKILDASTVHFATKAKAFRGISLLLETDNIFSAEQMQQLIVVFNAELNHDMKYSPLILKSFKNILPLVSDNNYPVHTELAGTAEVLMKYLIRTAPLQQARELKVNYFDLLMLLPQQSKAEVCKTNPDTVYRMVDQFLGNSNIDVEMKKSILLLLQVYYQAIPVDDRSDFVENGMSTWFSRLIPTMFDFENVINGLASEIIEEMTPEIIKKKYVSNTHWPAVLKSVSSANCYPAVMVQLLKSGNLVWGKLWRCITKLLRPYLRKAEGPITPLLTVLENAFTGDKLSRCEAFNCWTVLIDNFVLETKEIFNTKQIKLIVTPLDANNSRTEEISTAKFKTWWHLIKVLEPNIFASYTKSLITFLNFCYGDPKTIPKVFVTASDFPSMHKQLVNSYVEIMGHKDCSDCVSNDIEKLQKGIFTNAIFEPDHVIWIHYTKQVILIIGKRLESSDEILTDELYQNMKCIWYSFLEVATKINDKSLHAAVLKNIMVLISSLTEECSEIPSLAELLLTIIFPRIVDAENGYNRSLLNDSSLNIMGGLSPIQSIMLLLLNKNLYQGNLMEKKSFNFECFIEAAFEGSVIDFCGWILPRLSGRLHSPQIWCCLSKILCQAEHQLNTDLYKTVLLWPINNKVDLNKIVIVSSSWKHLLACLRSKITSPKNKYDEGILVRILEVIEDSDNTEAIITALFILPIIIRQRFKDSPAGQAKYLKGPLSGLEKVLMNLKKSEKTDYNLMGLCGAIEAIGTIFSSIAERRTPYTIKPLIEIAKLIADSIINESNQPTISVNLSSYICKILRQLNSFLLPLYFPSLAVNVVHVCLSFVKHKYIPNVFKSSIDVLKEVLKANAKNKVDAINVGKINEALTEKGMTSPTRNNATNQGFKTPASDAVETPEGKSKYFQIPVNKSSNVEYVVIRPSWKLQASKLTEHQLEGRKRKRENIPALYEDLSQSQDKTLNSWTPPGYKSDTVDDSSKSRDENDISKSSEPLTATKEMVEKISPSITAMKDCNSPQTSVLSKKKVSDKTDIVIDEIPHDENINIEQSTITPRKLDKSRGKGSFRSRLNQNFLKLRGSPIEAGISPNSRKINVSDEEKIVNPDPLLTPVNKEKLVSSNTGSSDIVADRPSRIKRKPNKFFPDDDCFENKKKRISVTTIDSAMSEVIDSENAPVIEAEKSKLNNQTIVSVANSSVDCSSTQSVIKSPDEPRVKVDMPSKKNTRRSRLESQLAINTVEGNPTIETNSQRLTRKRRRDSVDSTNSPSEESNKKQSLKSTRKLNTKKKAAVVEEVMKSSNKLSIVKDVSEKNLMTPEVSSPNPEIIVERKKDDSPPKDLYTNPPDAVVVVEIADSPIKQADGSIQNISSDIFSDSEFSSNKMSLVNKIKKFSTKDMAGNKSPVKDSPVKKLSSSDLECSEDVIQSSQSSPDTSLTFTKAQRRISTIVSNNKYKTPSPGPPKVVVVPLVDKFYTLRHDTRLETKKFSYEDDDNETVEDQNVFNKKVNQSTTQLKSDSNKIEKLQEDDCQILDDKLNEPIKSASDVNLEEMAATLPDEDIFSSIDDQIVEIQPNEIEITTNSIETVDEYLSIASKLDAQRKNGISETSENEKESCVLINDICEIALELSEKNLTVPEVEPNEEILIDGREDIEEIISEMDTESVSLLNNIEDDCFIIEQPEINSASDNSQQIAEADTQPVIKKLKVTESNVTIDLKDEMITMKEKQDKITIGDATIVDNTPTKINGIEEIQDEIIIVEDSQPKTANVKDTLENKLESNRVKEILGEINEVEKIQDFSNEVTINIPEDSADESKIVLQLDCSSPEKDDDFIQPDDTSDESIKESNGLVFHASILSSPCREDIEDRNADFLNSTLDISPIKGVVSLIESETHGNRDEAKNLSSPDKAENDIANVPMEISPPKASGSNMMTSPEIFCSEKISPEKADVSPPRSSSLLSSPSSMLAQKKNRATGSRAAQMLGLCNVDLDSVRQCINKANENGKKESSPVGTPVRKNLHHFYGNGFDANGESNAETKSVLGFSKLLPSPSASPAGPILKINHPKEDHTVSPSSKRKRVSFHDPPVSTSINVEKYIDSPQSTRSPQSVKNYRDEFSFMKSPKRMVVKCLAKKLEIDSNKESTKKTDQLSNADNDKDSNCDSQIMDMCSLVIESPQALEITNNHLLVDDSPIYPSLCKCQAPISEIAAKLMSPMWKDFFLKDLRTEVSTIGDLASMTELQVNRLPIKSPKIEIVKKVLAEYESKHLQDNLSTVTLLDEETHIEPVLEADKTISHIDSSEKLIDDLTHKNEQIVTDEPLANKTQDEISPDSTNSICSHNSSEIPDVPPEFRTSTISSLAPSCPEEMLNTVVAQLPASVIFAKFSASSILQHVRSLIEADKDVLVEATEMLRSALEPDIRKRIVSENEESISQIKRLCDELNSRISKC